MLNKIILMGRLVRDPELKTTQSNTSICTFTVAVNRDFVVKDGQETDFINIIALNKTAEFVSKYFVKGQLMAITGRLQARNWEDKDGNKRVQVEVKAEEIHFAESKQAKQNTQKSEQKQTQASDFSFDASDFEENLEDGDLPF